MKKFKIHQYEDDFSQQEAAKDSLGYPGAMISGSKRIPKGKEDHQIYWNACVFNKNGNQIWHGDLDITESEKNLQALADKIGTIYVTPEQPWRFDGFNETKKKAPYYAERIVEFRRTK